MTSVTLLPRPSLTWHGTSGYTQERNPTDAPGAITGNDSLWSRRNQVRHHGGWESYKFAISEFVGIFFFFLVSVNYNDLNMIHILGWEFIIPPNFGDSFSKCKILFTFFVILHFGFLIHWCTWHSSDFLSLLKVRNHPINQLFNTCGISATVSEALIYTVQIM